MPPAGLLPRRPASRDAVSVLRDELAALLMAAAGTLASPVLAASMRTLIGLLASTGIRIGEAFALDVADIDTAGQVLTVTGKYGKTRLIALHPTAAAALAGYLQIRARHALTTPAPCSSATVATGSTATWPARSSGHSRPAATWHPSPAAGSRDCTIMPMFALCRCFQERPGHRGWVPGRCRHNDVGRSE